MSKLNTLYKIVNTMKEEEYQLNQMKVEVVKEEETTLIFEGQHEGHHKGHGGRMHRRGRMQAEMKEENFKSGKLSRIGMALKALDRLEIEENEDGKVLTLEVDAKDIPFEMKEMHKNFRSEMKGKRAEFKENGKEGLRHKKMKMMDEKDMPAEMKERYEKRKKMMAEHMAGGDDAVKDHLKFEEMKAVKEKIKALGLTPETCEFKSAKVKALVDQDNKVTQINIVATIETQEQDTLLVKMTKAV